MNKIKEEIMKTAILHISDFHIKENKNIRFEKIDKMINSLNVLGKVDKFIIIFSGDLAYSGKINEYKNANTITGKIFNQIKNISNGEEVVFLMVPGNHDMILESSYRKCDDILNYYKSGVIYEKLNEEIHLFDNFYKYSKVRMSKNKDKIIDNYFLKSGSIKIQVNLINTAYFSTLKQDDKELHYFPLERLESLSKFADLNITVMHHTTESYNCICKNKLEQKIYLSTDILLTGHNHFSQTKQVSINGNKNLLESCGGEIDFYNFNSNDVFNVLVLDNETLMCNGYSFTWNENENIFKHELILANYKIKKYNELSPLDDYVNNLHNDQGNRGKDFTKYFIFPKLTKKNSSDYCINIDFTLENEFIEEIIKNKKIVILGKNYSGKTILLKKLYLSFVESYIPLFFDVFPSMKIDFKNFIRKLFIDQYGEDEIKYEKFLQTPKEKKIIFIDNIDFLVNCKHNRIDEFYKILSENFEFIVVTATSLKTTISEKIKKIFFNEDDFNEYEINPFFLKKRNELITNICIANNINDQKDIEKINNIIDTLYRNNNGLFTLNPSFLIKYTQYFTMDNQYEYVKGEQCFNKIFESEIYEALLTGCSKDELEEYFTIFEFVAYAMFKGKKDTLEISEIKNIVAEYNENYGMSLKSKSVIEVGEKSKIIIQTDDCGYYFANKNYLAYFIAKRLFFMYQTDGISNDVKHALKNICFGINSNIIMFYIYLSNNVNTIYNLNDEIETILCDTDPLDLDDLNIPLLKRRDFSNVNAPTNEEQEQTDRALEKKEQMIYENENMQALGIFDYDESTVDYFDNRISRAIAYLEIVCKSIPSYYSKIPLQKKEKLKEAVYKYPEKIAYSMLAILDENCDEICIALLNYANYNNIKKENGKVFEIEDCVTFLQQFAIATVLVLFDHFSEMCITKTTFQFMVSNDSSKSTNKLQKTLMLAKEAPADDFINQTKNIFNKSDNVLFKHMIKLIMKKYLYEHKSLEHRYKQSIFDIFLPGATKKKYLLESSKK